MQGLSPHTKARAASFRITHSSRRLQRSWRRFASQHKSTAQLAKAFADQGIALLDSHEEHPAAAAAKAPEVPHSAVGGAASEAASAEGRRVSSGGGAPASGVVMVGGIMAGGAASERKHACFEEFAKKLQSATTIKTAQVRVVVCQGAGTGVGTGHACILWGVVGCNDADSFGCRCDPCRDLQGLHDGVCLDGSVASVAPV